MNKYTVDFFLKSGKRISTVTEAEDIEKANLALEKEIMGRSVVQVKNHNDLYTSIISENIEYVEVRPQKLHQHQLNK